MNELNDTPKHKDLIYDIGMCEGEDTEFYLRKGFRVIAFEADPELARLCRNRLKGFIDQGQLTVVQGAIVDLDSIEAGQEKALFYRNNDKSDWGTVCSDRAECNVRLGTSNSMLEVDVIDLPSIMLQYGIPHYMKIDIEGMDMICVDALRRFRERPDYISIESDKTSFANIKHEINTLVDLGYNSFQAVEQSAKHLSQSPPHPAREGTYAAQRFGGLTSGLFGLELGGDWKSKHEILRQYRIIRLGYYLLGDDGIVSRSNLLRAVRLHLLIYRFLKHFTKAEVPGWYDTHARHFRVETGKV